MTHTLTVEQIRERWAKATPPPWLPEHLPGVEKDCDICQIDATYTKNANRVAIAQAPTDIAWLLKVAEAAQRDYKRHIRNDCMGKFQGGIWDGCTKNACGMYYTCEVFREEATK